MDRQGFRRNSCAEQRYRGDDHPRIMTTRRTTGFGAHLHQLPEMRGNMFPPTVHTSRFIRRFPDRFSIGTARKPARNPHNRCPRLKVQVEWNIALAYNAWRTASLLVWLEANIMTPRSQGGRRVKNIPGSKSIVIWSFQASKS